MREGLTAIVSVRLAEPQFEGQTKSKLGNTEIRSMVERLTNERFGRWLEEHPNPAKAIVGKATTAARARTAAKAARELTRRKSALEGVGMPDKLADCSQRSADGTELFIVEGNSAGGSARDARDPRTQAILPLRGKVLNVERASLDKILANAEIQALVAAIGGGIGHDFDLDKVRYERDRDPERRRRRRRPHPHAADHVLLPPDVPARRGRAPLRCAAAAVLGGDLAARRSTSPTTRRAPG